jgi:hypothetical protein
MRFWSKPARRLRTRAVIAAASALTLGLAATALAAHPKAGKKYSGFTSQSAINGFKPPVSFKVSGNGKTILGFTWAWIGCSGSGGTVGDPWTRKAFMHSGGNIAVTSKGTFSGKPSTSTFSVAGTTIATTSTVKGKFNTAKRATGTITFSQKLTSSTSHLKCAGPRVTFTATTK